MMLLLYVHAVIFVVLKMFLSLVCRSKCPLVFRLHVV